MHGSGIFDQFFYALNFMAGNGGRGFQVFPQLDDQQVSKMGEEFGIDFLDVQTALIHGVYQIKGGGDIAAQRRPGKGKKIFPGGDAEEVDDVLMGQLIAAAAYDLVQQAQGVPDAAAGFPGDELQAAVFYLETFRGADAGQMVDNGSQ